MIDVYDTLMDSLAALAVEAVCTPVTAVQSYWLLLVAQQHILASLTLEVLLRLAHEETVLPMPRWPSLLPSGPGAPMARGGWWKRLGRWPCTGVQARISRLRARRGALEDSVSAVYRRDSGLRLSSLAGGVPSVWPPDS